MRHLVLTICLLLTVGTLTAQHRTPANRASEQELDWTPVKKVCGRLRTIERGVFVTAPKKELRLYQAKWRQPCCKDLKLVGTRTTSAAGAFDFGNIQSGRYWLALEFDGVEKGTPIDVDVRHDWVGSCEAQGPDIEKNSISWGAGEGRLM